MGDWKATHKQCTPQMEIIQSQQLIWERIQTWELRHPDILKKLVGAYDKYAQDVGVVIPRGASLGTLQRIFPASNHSKHPNY